jgi:peptidoglycan/LPS O-acetylase OafA/YrhL
MNTNAASRSFRLVDRLRRNAKNRTRDTILSAVATILLAGASVWMESMSGGLQSRAEDVYAARDHRSLSSLRNEIWLAQEIAVRRSSLHLSAMLFAIFCGAGAAVTGSHWFGRKDDALVILWDKVAALESQSNELNGRPSAESQ